MSNPKLWALMLAIGALEPEKHAAQELVEEAWDCLEQMIAAEQAAQDAAAPGQEEADCGAVHRWRASDGPGWSYAYCERCGERRIEA